MKKKLALLLSTMTLLLGLAVGVAAAPVLEKISADLNWSIKFIINGKEWTPNDTAGNKLAPINYNGSNYLPVRAVAEAFNIAVDWDGDNQIIYLGEKTDSVIINDEKIDIGYSSNVLVTTDKQYTVQEGVDYSAGIVIKDINSASKSAKLVPDGKYQTLELNFFAFDISKDIEIRVIDADNTVLKHINLSTQTNTGSTNIDIGGVREVKIEVKGSVSASDRMFITGNYR